MSDLMTQPFPRERRHTLHYLEAARPYAAVYLNTEVDMTMVEELRGRYFSRYGAKLSYVAVLTRVISEVVRRYPQANSSLQTFPRARICQYRQVSTKLTSDKFWNGSRAVVSAVVRESDRLSLREIQHEVDRLREANVETAAGFRGVRLLSRVPVWLGRWLYRLGMWDFAGREQLQGTITITSLGHRGIQAFFPISSSTLCFGVGAVQTKPVVAGGAIVARPMMTLNLTFDHRVIDGAMAADMLTEIRLELERLRVAGLLEEEGAEVEAAAQA